MTTYKIVRFYFDDDLDNEVVKEGLSLDEAKRHCQSRETSSTTCKKRDNKERTEKCGPWFDGFMREQ